MVGYMKIKHIVCISSIEKNNEVRVINKYRSSYLIDVINENDK